MVKHLNRAAGWFLAVTFVSAAGILLGHPYTTTTIASDVVFALLATAVEAYLTRHDTPKPPTPTMRFA